jgi:hypothetical protein
MMAMSEKPAPKNIGGLPIGTVGLLFTIIFCVGIALSTGGLYWIVLECILGLAGSVLSIVGIVKGSGRYAGIFGIVAFLLGCLMTFSVILDIIAQGRGHSG